MMVRVFDSSKSITVGEVDFLRLVLVNWRFLLLWSLGHPWIHTFGAILSNLHQKSEIYQKKRQAHHYYGREREPDALLISHPIHRYIGNQRR